MNAQRLTKGRVLGDVLADFVAEQIGSWRFVAWQSVVLATWICWNVMAPAAWRFDPPPFIGLNLLLSFEAAYCASVLLIAANRQAMIDRRLLHQAETHARQAEHHSRETHALVAEVRAALKRIEGQP